MLALHWTGGRSEPTFGPKTLSARCLNIIRLDIRYTFRHPVPVLYMLAIYITCLTQSLRIITHLHFCLSYLAFFILYFFFAFPFFKLSKNNNKKKNNSTKLDYIEWRWCKVSMHLKMHPIILSIKYLRMRSWCKSWLQADMIYEAGFIRGRKQYSELSRSGHIVRHCTRSYNLSHCKLHSLAIFWRFIRDVAPDDGLLGAARPTLAWIALLPVD